MNSQTINLGFVVAMDVDDKSQQQKAITQFDRLQELLSNGNCYF
jgi:hypothetical protein